MRRDSKYRVGIIGAGMVAFDGHIPAYRLHDDKMEIVAICDSNIDKVKDVAEKHRIPQYYQSAEQMIKECDLDIASICTPNMSHAGFAELLLDAGVHVLCEKPLTLSYAEATKMFKKAAEKGLMLETCQTQRFHNEYRKVRDYVTSGKAGSLLFCNCTCVRRRGAPMRGSFLSSALNGGGAFADIGVHFIDAVLWMMGSPKVLSITGLKNDRIIHNERESDRYFNRVEAGAYGKADLGPMLSADECDVEDFASGTMRLEGGICLNFCIGWNANMPAERSITILGDKMGFKLPNLITYKTANGENIDIIENVPAGSEYSKMAFPGHCYLLDMVLDHLENGAPLLITPDETLNVVAALELFYRSCAAGREVFRTEL
jgi:predicted dehydrogenase